MISYVTYVDYLRYVKVEITSKRKTESCAAFRFATRRDILSAVLRLQQSSVSGSNMAAGFQRLHDEVFVVGRGSRPTAAKYIVLLTDGTTSQDPQSTQYHVINNWSK